MTVRELIAVLERAPQDALVTSFDGFDSGKEFYLTVSPDEREIDIGPYRGSGIMLVQEGEPV